MLSLLHMVSLLFYYANWQQKHTHKIHTKMYSYMKMLKLDIHENTNTTAIKANYPEL